MKPEVPIGAIHHGKGGRRKPPQVPRWRGATTQRRNPSQPMCYRCGHTPAHDLQQRPAKNEVCNKCRKCGHFKQVCTGLGKLEGGYAIRLQKGAQPFALNIPRRVPVSLMQAVKDKLDCMQQLRVIELVETPTEWCAEIVVVP